MADEWQDLQAFIREMRGPSPLGIDEALTRDMDLHHDLDWSPKKIVEIMKIWARRFNVDINDFGCRRKRSAALRSVARYEA